MRVQREKWHVCSCRTCGKVGATLKKPVANLPVPVDKLEQGCRNVVKSGGGNISDYVICALHQKMVIGPTFYLEIPLFARKCPENGSTGMHMGSFYKGASRERKVNPAVHKLRDKVFVMKLEKFLSCLRMCSSMTTPLPRP